MRQVDLVGMLKPGSSPSPWHSSGAWCSLARPPVHLAQIRHFPKANLIGWVAASMSACRTFRAAPHAEFRADANWTLASQPNPTPPHHSRAENARIRSSRAEGDRRGAYDQMSALARKAKVKLLAKVTGMLQRKSACKLSSHRQIIANT